MTLSIECDMPFLSLKVIKFLDEHVVPAGVRVVALQGLEWLTACINCHASAATGQIEGSYRADRGQLQGR